MQNHHNTPDWSNTKNASLKTVDCMTNGTLHQTDVYCVLITYDRKPDSEAFDIGV